MIHIIQHHDVRWGNARENAEPLNKTNHMNPTHIHLIITHMPIFGSFFGTLVLIHGLWAKSNTVKIAAYNIFILSALGASIAFFTGESAEETVESIAGVNEQVIEEHEEAADFALGAFIVLGVAAVVAIPITAKNMKWAVVISRAMLVAAAFSFVVVARTGYLGGKIRHTELNTTGSTGITTDGEQEEDD